MRILMFSWRDLANQRAGGAELYTHKVLQAWSTMGHDVTLFTSEVPHRPSREIVDGYEVVRRGTWVSVYREARRFWLNEARGLGFDAVIDQVNTRPFLCPSFVSDVPIVAFFHQIAHDVWLHELPLPVALAGKHLIEPRWIKVYKHVPVLTVSPSSRNSLVAFGLEDVRVLPMGQPEPPPLDVARDKTPRLVFVGRLAANKRPDHALEAFKLIRSVLSGAKLDIVGAGPLQDRLQRRAVQGVTFHGRVSEQRKYELLAQAHALLATSVREGWGMMVSEAASVGTPTIGYDVPGLCDSITASGGILVPPSPKALAERVVQELPSWVSKGTPDCKIEGVAPWEDIAVEMLDHIDTVRRA